MANWKIELSGKGLRKATVDKLVKELVSTLGEEVGITVSDNSPPNSRFERFDLARATVEDSKTEAESLRDELQDWYDNLPEQFQSGDKGDQLESAISQLDDFISHCESAADCDVDFPGMY